MHRQTPLSAAFVGYSGGGSRTLIDTIDDGQLMQEMKGTMMHGEAREKVESPQNYGFSSVVRPATKGSDGQIQDAAEGYMSYAGGNRTHSFCAVMDDRRYRPLGLKPGENCQYDDVAQMTLIRRTGVYILSNDNPEDNQSQSGGSSGSTPGQRDDSSGSQSTERMVSLRHVEKKKQQRPSRGGGGQSNGSGSANGGGASTRDSSSGSSSSSSQDYKHEGESVNTEVRCTKKRISFFAGTKEVGYYDVPSDTWYFTAKVIHNVGTQQVKDEAPQIDHN